MATAWYRLSSFEVGKISLTNFDFAANGLDTTIYGVLTDPTLTDGSDCVDSEGNLRVLGISKFAVVGSNTIRNATQLEIDTFAPAQVADEAVQDVAQIINDWDLHPRERRKIAALIKRILAENNLQAVQWNAFRAQVALATNLANLQSRVATNTADMPIRTFAQAKTALKNDLSVAD